MPDLINRLIEIFSEEIAELKSNGIKRRKVTREKCLGTCKLIK